ncbi:hypothetical protein B0H65DRAFT_425427, partial [Neurospora tetraspora]
RECVICRDHFRSDEVATVPCHHDYCRPCLVSLFTAAMTDESLFPPRCCSKPINLDQCRFLLGPQLVGRFLAKKLEFETPNRTYCSQPTCSFFIPPLFIRQDVATCVKCGHKTCGLCRGQAHTGTDCPGDPAAQEVLAMAEREGWKRCHSCKRMVELKYGCNHITCPCGAHFCYACGDIWKTCRCEFYSEEALMAQANRHVNRDAGAGQLPGPVRQQRVAAAAQHLLENHECAHARWTGRGGRFQCEECYDWLPRYIYECRQCRLLACRRCRFNRL